MSTSQKMDVTEHYRLAFGCIQRLIHGEKALAPCDRSPDLGVAFTSVMMLFCEQYDVSWEVEELEELEDRLENMPPSDFQKWLSSALETIRQPREKFRHQPQPLELSQIA